MPVVNGIRLPEDTPEPIIALFRHASLPPGVALPPHAACIMRLACDQALVKDWRKLDAALGDLDPIERARRLHELMSAACWWHTYRSPAEFQQAVDQFTINAQKLDAIAAAASELRAMLPAGDLLEDLMAEGGAGDGRQSAKAAFDLRYHLRILNEGAREVARKNAIPAMNRMDKPGQNNAPGLWVAKRTKDTLRKHWPPGFTAHASLARIVEAAFSGTGLPTPSADSIWRNL